jgi:serine/threonine protein kinase
MNTVIVGGPAGTGAPSHTLPPGTRLRDYRVENVLGEGGFGIVYLAVDPTLQRKVAIKEYMPSTMAARAGDGISVIVKAGEHAETYSSPGCAASSTRRGCWCASTTRHWSRCTSSGSRQRHRLHGDAVLRRTDAQARADLAWAGCPPRR